MASGGLRDLIPAVARACVAVGIDGIFMEVCPSTCSAAFTTEARRLRLWQRKVTEGTSALGPVLALWMQFWL